MWHKIEAIYSRPCLPNTKYYPGNYQYFNTKGALYGLKIFVGLQSIVDNKLF